MRRAAATPYALPTKKNLVLLGAMAGTPTAQSAAAGSIGHHLTSGVAFTTVNKSTPTNRATS